MQRRVRFHGQSRLPLAISGLLNTGWRIRSAPDETVLPRNGQAFVLEGGAEDKRIRLFAYTVTSSSRNRPHEKRVEITRTYNGTLMRSPLFEDVVIAFDRERETWVGIDGRRLDYGGATHNASTFLPSAGFANVPTSGIHILPMESNIISLEFAAFFNPNSIAEYIFNRDAIHAGSYSGRGKFSGNVVVKKPANLKLEKGAFHGNDIVILGPPSLSKAAVVDQQAVEAMISGDTAAIRKLKLTREELLEIKRRCDEIGLKGERWALDYERKRLKRAGLHDLANQIVWVSQTHPYEGYDIESFNEDGSPKFIEVKTTVSKSKQFEISDNEWRRADELGSQYEIYRITGVESMPNLRRLPDPIGLLKAGALSKAASSWMVKYS